MCLKPLFTKCQSNSECSSDLCDLGICVLVTSDCVANKETFMIGMSVGRVQADQDSICGTILSRFSPVALQCNLIEILSIFGVNKLKNKEVTVFMNCSLHNVSNVRINDVLDFDTGLCESGFSYTLFHNNLEQTSSLYSDILNDIATGIKINRFDFKDSIGYKPVHRRSKVFGSGVKMKTCEASVVVSSSKSIALCEMLLILLMFSNLSMM